jgi:glycerol kinase
MVETTALGAAGLAGIATGLWRDAAHFLGERPAPTVFEPRQGDDERSVLLAGWRRAVSTTLSWADQ